MYKPLETSLPDSTQMLSLKKELLLVRGFPISLRNLKSHATPTEILSRSC